MKRINIYLSALFAVFIISCESETMDKIKDAKSKVSNATSVIGNATKMEEKATAMDKRLNELKEIEPISNDEFKAWMPEELGDLTRSSYEFNTMMGATGTLKFKNDEKSMDVTIFDGAGEMGSALYASQGFLGSLYGGFESESDTKKQEIVEKDGREIIQTYYKDKNNSEVRFNVDDRFVVSANATNMNPEEVYDLLLEMKIKELH